MKLTCGNVWAAVEGAPTDHAFLRDYLSVKKKGAEHSEAFRRGVWDGRERLYKEKEARFPSGLVRAVVAAAKKQGIDVEVVDARVAPAAGWDETRIPFLRDYQLDGCRAGVQRRRGMIVMPTGSGKTQVFVGLALGFAALRWLVLVDTKDLLQQAAERFEKYSNGEKAGRWGDGVHDARRFTVATLQSIHRGLEAEDPRVVALVARAQGLIVDEVHVLPAETYFSVAMACEDAYFRFGTTATALMRGDERDFLAVGATGPVIYEVDPKTLMDRGLLARPRIIFVENPCPKVTGSFEEVYEALVMLSDDRNELVVEMARAAPRPTLVFVRRETHGHELARRLRVSGLRAEFVWGKSSTPARAAAAERLQRGNIDVLVTSKIFNKGVDLPLIGGGVNAAGGASGIDALQRLGRFMRTAKGKKDFVYYDVLDRNDRWLRRHASARMETYRADGYEVEEITRSELAARAAAA